MNIIEALSKVNQYLIRTGLDGLSPTFKAHLSVEDYITAQDYKLKVLVERIAALEDIDEKMSELKDFTEEVVNEFCAFSESGSSIDYGKADELRNKWEMIK